MVNSGWRFFRSGGQDNPEDDYTKGLIVSFTAKKIGGSDEAEKASDDAEKTSDDAAADATTEGGDGAGQLSREDIKGGLAKFGIIRVCFFPSCIATALMRRFMKG